MLRTYLYLPKDLNDEVEALAKVKNESKAKVLRTVIKKGIKQVKKKFDTKENASLEVLFRIAELGKKYKLKGPSDGFINMDKYLWGKDWSKK